MVDVVPHCRQQVHEPLGDAVELLREPRHRVAQLTDSVALEARVIGDDAARPGARLDQRFSERGPRILGAVGDPLVMHQLAAPLLDVDAELTGTSCHGRHPGQRGMARLTVSKSRKASGDVNWASAVASEDSTTMRPVWTAFTWRAWITDSSRSVGRS